MRGGHNKRNLSGLVFGRLTVTEEAPKRGGRMTWHCLCECGKRHTATGTDLVTQRVRSCGCLNAESIQAKALRHGFNRTPTYVVWSNMLARCSNDKRKDYKNYGGRGISVCERWGDFVNFLADMGAKPPLLSLDRINNDGNYEPGNCRWATASQQRNNQRPRAVTRAAAAMAG